jgi:hypothetical protein
MKSVQKTIKAALCLATLLTSSACIANNIAVSGSVLDIDTGNNFDEATITISGPKEFNTSYTLKNNKTQVDIETLKITDAGNYTYQIQYIQNGKLEYITDPKTGRKNAQRNTGLIETTSGYFNVSDNQFVLEELSEADPELNTQQIQNSRY